MKGWLPSFFYSNWFYGCCVVALSIEASLQQGFALNRSIYYVVLFCATVIYYTYAYRNDKGYAPNNERSRWYLTHRKLVTTYQVQFGLMALLCSIFLWFDYGEQVLQMNAEEWGLAAIFPLLALGYYGTLQFGGKHFNLRNLGLLKPFIIGFIWAGSGYYLSPTLSSIGNGSALCTRHDGLVIFPKEFCIYQHPLHSL